MELFIFIAFHLLIEVQSYSSLQKPFISYNGDDVQPIILCEIPLSVRADVTCSLYTEDGLLHKSYSQKRQSGDHYCMFYLIPGELLTGSVNRQLSCDYSLNTEPEIRSPHSDTITIRVSIVTSALPEIISGHVLWLLVVLVFTGVGLFLSVLMGFICLYHFDSSDDVLTEVNYSSCQVETTSLLTSSVCSKKHG